MKNESKVVVLAGVFTLVMLIVALSIPVEHAKYWYNFPGFETLYGAAGVLFFIVAMKSLSKFNQKEGLIDD